MLTLAQALDYNKKTKQQDPRTIKNWYAKGYYLKQDEAIKSIYRWYITVGGKEFVKYSTA